MKPITCAGNFAVPIMGGRFRLRGICATVDDVTANSRLGLVDDPNIKQFEKTGYVLSDLTDQEGIVVDVKGVASVDGTLKIIFDEPIPVIHGLSAYTDNLLAGSICVYME